MEKLIGITLKCNIGNGYFYNTIKVNKMKQVFIYLAIITLVIFATFFIYTRIMKNVESKSETELNILDSNSETAVFIQNDWKIIKQPGQEWELFNLKDDPQEVNDLAKKQPKKLKELRKEFEKEKREIEKAAPGY